MKKSKLFLILALVLSLAVGLGGTLAYLTDTDEAVNVMTLGNVQIEQIELQRAEGVDYNNGGNPLKLGDLVPFQQGKALFQDHQPLFHLMSTPYSSSFCAYRYRVTASASRVTGPCQSISPRSSP